MTDLRKRTSVWPLFDTHCHLDLPELAVELPMWLQQAEEAGVQQLLVPAVSPARWPVLHALKTWHQQQAQPLSLHFAYGIHPWWMQEATEHDLDVLEQQLRLEPSSMVAVGECGLDFALDWLDPEHQHMHRQQQLALLEAQVLLARKYHKPLVLHHRKSQSELLQLLKRLQFDQGGILHAFSGSQAQAHAFLDLGFKLGIGGTITYPRASKTRHTVAHLPKESLVLETDAPSMPLFGYQGQANHPAQLRQVLAVLAELRAESMQELAEQCFANSLAVLRLDRR